MVNIVQALYLELNKVKQIVELYRIPKDVIKLLSPQQEELPLFGVLNP
ncbi:hypothetical protein [Bacillus cereus]